MQVREYAWLTTDRGAQASLDLGIISRATFDWLLELSQKPSQGKPFVRLENLNTLKLGSYVGYLQSPAGEAIEVLPKTGLGSGDSSHSRFVLQAMLRSTLTLPFQEHEQADLLRMDVPLHEWVIGQFLVELKKLVQRGLRFEYRRIEEESAYVRGQLNMPAQLRQPPGREHHFHIRHDEFSPQRLENRLLKSALVIARQLVNVPDNWRLANELAQQLEVLEPATQPLLDLKHWRTGKLMRSYDAIRPWCDLILERLNPSFQWGHHRGIALLFPMERLFEDHVAKCLDRSVTPGWKLRPQANSEWLLSHTPSYGDRRRLFQLRPDLVLQRDDCSVVLDTKWKLLDSKSASDPKYGISQTDLYQMLAYGHKYQAGAGELMLIYPRHGEFTEPLPPFYYDKGLRLWIVPFCLISNRLIQGEWCEFFNGIDGMAPVGV